LIPNDYTITSIERVDPRIERRYRARARAIPFDRMAIAKVRIVQNPARSARPSPIDDIGQLLFSLFLSRLFFVPRRLTVQFRPHLP